jgi:polar amino acid transport system substrate-binding protein
MSRARPAVAVFLAAAALTASACAPQPQPQKTAASAAAGACSTHSPSLYKQGRLTVATDSPAYAPWFDDNNPSDGKGFESAVAYAVAAKLGFAHSQVTWVVEPFDNSYAPGAKDFDFDINEISITAQRAKAVDFSTGYYTVSQAVLTLSTSKYAGATSLAQLKDAKIGVQVATTSYQAVLGEIKPAKRPSVFNTTDDEVNALKNGQIDAVVTDLPTVFYLASAELDNGKIVGQFGYDGSTPEQFGLLLGKGSGLTTCVDQALAGLTADGTLPRLTSQWLSASADAPELR